MSIIDGFPQKLIASIVLGKEKAHNDNYHRVIPRGRLSASLLGNPLQWQILKIFGVPGTVMDEYTLRKFQRGRDVEDRVMGWLNPLSQQDFVEYRGVVGLIDAMVDTADWDFAKGCIPLEVKSVANAKFKRITMAGKPDRSHCLQGCLYALAKGCEWFAVMYVASDDYRVHTFMVPVADWKAEVDRIINRFDQQLLTGRVPAFVPDEAWQGNTKTGKPSKYNPFPDFALMTEEQIEAKIQEIISSKS